RTSPSAIARYFFHDCERFLRFLAASAELRRKEGLPEVEFDHSPLIRALLDSGYAWEETVLQQYAGVDVLVAPGEGPCHTRRFDWQQTLQLLRSAQPGAMIYQPTLRLPRAFYDQYGIDSQLVTISDNHPDLITVLPGEDGQRVLRLIDLKRGESLQLTHRVQVLLYALELETVVRQEGLDDVRVDLDTGGVWLGSHAAPTEFLVGDLRPHLESFLRQDLIRILRTAADEARWHVHFRCEWCEFFKHCWSQMQRTDDLSRLSRLTPWGKRFLTERAGVRTTAQLGEFLQRPEADDVLSRCASLAGAGPRLAKQVAALEQGQPQPHGAASPSLSRGENIGLFLTLQQEPLNESIYLAGLYVTVRKDLREAVFSDEVREALFDGSRSRPLVLVAQRPDGVDDVRRRWVRLLHDVIVQVDQYNRDRDWKDQLSLQAYVLSEQERSLAVSWLLDSLRDPELAEQAMTLLFHFQAPELLAANEHPDREVPFPLVILLDALGQVLALPVEVNYTLPEALIALGSRTKLRRNEYFDFPLGPGMRAEPIHAAWRREQTETLDEIVRQAVARLQAAWGLLQSLRQLAAESIFTWSAKFTLPKRQVFADPLLSRLAFFARYESLLRCLEVRNLRCEPRPVQRLLGKALELEAAGDDRFQIVSGAMEISPGGYPEWLLVRDDDAGRRAQLEFRDYACRAQLWQRKQSDLALVGVAQVERDPLGTPAALTVSYPRGFDGDRPQAGERFLLHPRFTDFTTDGVVEFLRSGDAQTHGLLLRLLGDPSAAGEPFELDATVARLAAEQIRAFGMTESQAEAFRQICQRRVVPVWGPPGTGKTHFLATAILALAAAHARAGKPFRVLVTAFTHAAIENLLRKIAALRESCQPGSAVRVGKAKSWQGEETAGIETVEESRLGAWLHEHPQAIVGATVYSCLKQYGQLPPLDLSVIDEASQVRVPEAAIPIGLAGPQGRLVLAGDHLQLPPIVAGVYPETEPGQPLLHRSIFEAVAQRSGLPTSMVLGPGIVQQLTENFRMNDVLTSFSGGLLYGPAYRSFDRSVAERRLNLLPERCLDPFVEACLDPAFPLVFVVLDGVWAARENPPEAQLAAQLVAGLRSTLRHADGKLFGDDGAFFRDGVFVVSPHRAQIRAIQRELRRQRRWQSPPLVDTVDKMQGREADAVIVSYGVSDPEFAAEEAEFIYGLNRLNVAVTRARAKCVVCLPRPLLDAPPQVLDLPEAARGLAFMRELVQAVSRGGEALTFDLEDGVRATVYRARECYQRPAAIPRISQPSDELEPVPTAWQEPKALAVIEPYSITLERVTVELPTPETFTAAETATRYRRPGRGRKKIQPAADAGLPPAERPEPEPDSLLARLNDPQREAASHGLEPLLIIAGAGTGKTTTLVYRVARLISQGMPPERILLLTFTRRAAAQMVERVAAVLRDADVDRSVWGGTFHGTGTRLLRQYGKAIGIHPRFTIHDQGDAEDLMGALCRELDLGKDDKQFPKKRTCLAIHSYGMNAELPLDQVLDSQYPQYQGYAEVLHRLFAAYAERKAQLNVFDYDDLLLKWCDLLDHEEAGPAIRKRFDCVLVDEYQDTNRLQSRLLQSLCPDGRGLTVVGDDAQSIYSFRAATVRNIMDFPKQFPGTRIVTLEQNYRSTQPILEATNLVIAQASERYTKELWSSRADGPQPQLITCEDEHEQVEFVVGRILEHRKAGIPLSQQAVLFRASHHSIQLESQLAKLGLQFVKYGGLKFVEAAHVKDVLSVLRLAENPRDTVAGARALCLLPGVGPKKAEELLHGLSAADGRFDVWREAKIPAKSKDAWPGFVALMSSLASDGSEGDLRAQVRRALKFYQPILEQNYDNPTQRMLDLEELEQLAAQATDRATLLADLTVDPPVSGADFGSGEDREQTLTLS
ncbi:MAG: UvrD-helicase domain-containing protein, partial [Pirellulaceae bacterium]|nr:UvrD-helicase domain-containing protein [Pirellulaceae bacterium]